jgi:hypothetical protein
MARERNPLPKKTAKSRYPKKDSWSKNDEKLYKIMGGKSKTKYSEDQATYRDFGRTYGGPTDAVPVSERKRREAGIFFSDTKPPKKEMGPKRPLGPARRKPPKPPQGSRSSSSKGNGGKPLQISPVGTSRTAGYSRTKPTTIPKGYSLMTFLSSPPKYKLVKNAGKNRGR